MKQLVTNYTFNPATRQVTFTSLVTVDLAALLLITNVADNLIVYNFADPTKGASVAGNVITLDYATTAMDAGDVLQIFYEDGTAPLTDTQLRATAVPVSGPLTDTQLRATALPVAIASNQSTLPTSEVAKSLTTISGTVSTSGHNSLVSAPGSGQRIVVVAFVIQNEAATANTMILEDGTTAKWRCLGQNQGDGLALAFASGQCWRLANNAALQLNLSASTACGYSIAYYTEAV